MNCFFKVVKIGRLSVIFLLSSCALFDQGEYVDLDNYSKRVGLSEEQKGRVMQPLVTYVLQRDMLFSKSGKYATLWDFASSASEPVNLQEYLSHPEKWPYMKILEAGTILKSSHFSCRRPRALSSEIGWQGMVLEVQTGSYKGLLVCPQGDAFTSPLGESWSDPKSTYLKNLKD